MGWSPEVSHHTSRSKLENRTAAAAVESLSHVWLFVAPWTVAHQALVFMGFSRKEYWSGLPFPSLGDLPNPGIEPTSPVSPALAGKFFTAEPPGKPKNRTLWA